MQLHVENIEGDVQEVVLRLLVDDLQVVHLQLQELTVVPDEVFGPRHIEMFGSPVKGFNPQGADLHVKGEEGEVHLAVRVPVQQGGEGNQRVLVEPEGGGIVQVDWVSDLSMKISGIQIWSA